MSTVNKEDQMYEDLKEYREQTIFCSSTHMMRQAEIYPKLLKYQKDLLPSIFKYLKETEFGMFLHCLLLDITQTDPTVSAQSKKGASFIAYKVPEVGECWKEWWKENNKHALNS